MNRKRSLSFIFLLLVGILVMVQKNSFAENINDPVADAKSIVTDKNVRFSVLTPQMIRMEWSETGKFIDQATLVFLNRRLPVPEFRVNRKNGWIEIQTSHLNLRYKIGSGKFNAKNFQIEFSLSGKPVLWRPGMKNGGNLKGTIRTLDGVKGATDLEPGLISRDGWTLIDDTKRPLLDNSDWQWAQPAPGHDYQDWYFFGYGHDYKQALHDFTRVAGKIPLPPRFVFGVWWSRYWAYTDEEFRQLVHEFEIHDVPLDVLVIDMDWHETFNLRWWKKERDQAGQRKGWSGYTWDKILFPDPREFLEWCDEKGLKTPLNLHPASGVQPYEEKYPEMARAMGIDPATKKYVPFDIVNKKFAKNYMEILHHPLEKMGVDFWWLDWQQEHKTKIPGVNPTFWLNYVHFTDMERQGKRPLIFHRWGGLGNHRYQIGFSGDAISVWESLAFQPYFTATASNVLYGYWSHDIGGHMPGEVDPELYTRWIQFGVFSPVLRTHTTRNPKAERRIWAYPVDYFNVMRDAFLLRYALIPYVYTEARKAYDSGVSLCRPMYYDYPEEEAAYQFKDQYMFGDDLLVAPIVKPMDSTNMLVTQKVWLPEGVWIEWFTGNKLQGGKVVERSFALDEIPVYVKAGVIIPMQPKMRYSNEKPVDPLILTIFPGKKGETQVYEDAGNTLGYKFGEFAYTPVQFFTDNNELTVKISPTKGSFPGMVRKRGYEIRLPLSFPPAKAVVNGQELTRVTEENEIGWRYDGNKLTAIYRLPSFSVKKEVTLKIQYNPEMLKRADLMQGIPGKIARFKRVMPLLNTLWPKEWSPEILIKAAQTGNRIRLHPEQIILELETLKREIPEVLAQVEALKKVNKKVVIKALAHLGDLK